MVAAFDFFTVPTVTFQLLYCFFVIEHGRRKILHFNVTRHPTAEWVIQQLREALPAAAPYRYVIFDRDSKFDADVITFLRATGLEVKRTSVQAPWRNGIAERWVGSCRREVLDHVIALDEQHLRRLIRDYVNYHHEDRTHDSLEKDTPNGRPIEPRPSPHATVISIPRLGGLQHRYAWRKRHRTATYSLHGPSLRLRPKGMLWRLSPSQSKRLLIDTPSCHVPDRVSGIRGIEPTLFQSDVGIVQPEFPGSVEIFPFRADKLWTRILRARNVHGRVGVKGSD